MYGLESTCMKIPVKTLGLCIPSPAIRGRIKPSQFLHIAKYSTSNNKNIPIQDNPVQSKKPAISSNASREYIYRHVRVTGQALLDPTQQIPWNKLNRFERDALLNPEQREALNKQRDQHRLKELGRVRQLPQDEILSHQRRRYDVEQWQNVIDMHKKGISVTQIARQLNVTSKSVSDWVGQYRRTHGEPEPPRRRGYSMEEENRALEIYDKTRSPTLAAQATGVSCGTIKSWVRRRKIDGVTRGHVQKIVSEEESNTILAAVDKLGIKEAAVSCGIPRLKVLRMIARRNEVLRGRGQSEHTAEATAVD